MYPYFSSNMNSRPDSGRSTCTEALIPVPRLVGQEWMYPYFSSNMNSRPDSALTESPTALIPLASLSKTALTSPPLCMEMILSWSSSLTQVRKVLSLLWKMPRPSGQSLSMPETIQLLSNLLTHPGEWKVSSCKVTLKIIKSLLHQVLNIQSLLLGDSGRQSKSINVSSNPDPG